MFTPARAPAHKRDASTHSCTSTKHKIPSLNSGLHLIARLGRIATRLQLRVHLASFYMSNIPISTCYASSQQVMTFIINTHHCVHLFLLQSTSGVFCIRALCSYGNVTRSVLAKRHDLHHGEKHLLTPCCILTSTLRILYLSYFRADTKFTSPTHEACFKAGYLFLRPLLPSIFCRHCSRVRPSPSSSCDVDVGCSGAYHLHRCTLHQHRVMIQCWNHSSDCCGTITASLSPVLPPR